MGGSSPAGAAGRSGAGGTIAPTPAADASVPAAGGAGRGDAGGGAGRSDAGAGGAAGSDADASTGSGGANADPPPLPPANGGVDYQLGGAYAPADSVAIVSRDRNAPIAPGLYNVCYVNGFQIQPDEEAFWLDQHADLVLRDGGGQPVVDADWDEMLIDVGTPEKRAGVAAVVAEWIDGCRSAGFDAVEIDNLDSFSRSGGLLDENDAVAAMALFSEAAHAAGLAIAQKNSAELTPRRDELGTDFAVAEECNRYSECDMYTDAYGDHVLVIEYRRADFDTGCSEYPQLSIVLRDVELVTPGDAGYVYDGC